MMADRPAVADVHERIARSKGFVDTRTGVREGFLESAVGPDGLAILTRPAGETARAGLVICRSPGPEQGPLQRLEALMARALAARGLAAIRIRRGFAREGEASGYGLGEAVSEAEDAVVALREAAGVERVGAAGALLGAAVALTAARRLALPYAALLCPVDGPGYLRELYRRQLVIGYATAEDRAEQREPFEERLARGPASVRGLRLTQEGFDELSRLDLVALAREHPSRLLLAGVTRSGEPDAAVRSLASAAPGSEVATVQDVLPVPFGEIFVRGIATLYQADVRLEVDSELARIVAEWASTVAS
jgi:hypothetical protein